MGQSVQVTVLGSGTSHGVPMIGCDCAVCTSADPRDRRTRCAIFVNYDGLRVLVDTPPELRLQCVAAGVREVDAILFTHGHADHITGLDDVRRFNWIMHRPVPCFGTERTLHGLQKMFSYAFDHSRPSPHSRPALELHTIGEQPFEIEGRVITPIPLVHGHTPVLGFRFGRFAYCTDCNEIPEESLRRLEGLEVLVLDALRRRPHPAHLSVDEAVAIAQRLSPARTYLTHIAHDLGHEDTNRSLPPGIELAYDGLRIEC